MKKKIKPKGSGSQQTKLPKTILELLGIPAPRNLRKSQEELKEKPKRSFVSRIEQLCKDALSEARKSPIHKPLFEQWLQNRRHYDLIERPGVILGFKESYDFWGELFKVSEVLKIFEKSLNGTVWYAIIKKDETAVRALLNSEDIKKFIKNEVSRVNRVMRLDKSHRLSQKDGESLAYEAIKDAQRWYSDPRKAGRYDEWGVPFKDLVKRLPELYKRVFFYRLMEKIEKEVEILRGKNLYALPYQHPETGEDFLFLSQAALLLGLTERQLRYKISQGQIPEDCYCRFSQLEGRDYYHQLKRKRVPAIMIPVSQLGKIKKALESSTARRLQVTQKTYIRIGEAARKLAKKRGILLTSAKKYLKRNREHFGGKFRAGMWWFPEKRFGK